MQMHTTSPEVIAYSSKKKKQKKKIANNKIDVRKMSEWNPDRVHS